MALTPVEIRHLHLGRGLLGYARESVDRTLAEIADSFEAVWRERADLADRVEDLEAELVRYRDLESLLRTTLVTAERASQETRDQAKREAELILREAHAEARRVTHAAATENERLLAESRRVRALLEAALTTLDSGPGREPGEHPERWEAA